MPAETPGTKLPSPWKDFLGEIDKALDKPLEIHCIGGFALVFYYGIPRTTGDIDYYTAVPADVNLEEIAGNGSDLHRRYKIYLHRVTVATLPEEYEERLSEMASGQFERLRLLVPEPYDYILSKLQRAGLKDSDDALYLFRSRKPRRNSSRAVSPGIEGLSDRPARTARPDFGALDRNLRISRLTPLQVRRSRMNRCQGIA